MNLQSAVLDDLESGIEMMAPQNPIDLSAASAAASMTAASSSQSSHIEAQSRPESVNTEPQVLTQEELDKKPWKYIGYIGYSEFLASDNDFLIFRRFATASTRIALRLQDRVSELEEKLADCDLKYSQRNAEDVHNGSFRQDQKDRERVFVELHESLITYSKYQLILTPD